MKTLGYSVLGIVFLVAAFGHFSQLFFAVQWGAFLHGLYTVGCIPLQLYMAYWAFGRARAK